MKVLHVLPFPGVGGTEIATRRIADGLRVRGVESRAVLLQPTGDQIAYLADAGIPFTVPGIRPEPSYRSVIRFLIDSHAMARACREVDLIHCADVQGAYYLAVAGRLAGRPVLSHVRNRHADVSRRDLPFINATTHFAFVSRSTREQFALKVSDARAAIVYDGVRLPSEAELVPRVETAAAVRAELGLPPDAVIAAMFARVNPQKDYETLVRAACALHCTHPKLHFLVVGDRSEIALNRRHYEHVRSLINAGGVGDRFVFTGFRSDIQRLMLASDLCLLATNFEGLPLVLLEAMALARPCIATAVDGIPEVVDHNVTGLLHRHRDASDLAQGIARLVDDPNLARRIGDAARKHVQQRFSHECFSGRILHLYNRILYNHSRKQYITKARPGTAFSGHSSLPPFDKEIH